MDRHNDHIQIYVKKYENGYLLTDDGYTIRDLQLSGCELDTDKRKHLLSQTIRGFGVNVSNEDLLVKTDEKTFPQMKHNLIQAIISVNDLFYVSSPYVKSMFLEDVQGWLDQMDVRYTPRVSFMGKSGFTHGYDFVIPKSSKAPERVIKAVNHPEKSVIQNLMFTWEDTFSTRQKESRLLTVINDAEPVKESILSALDNYDISVVLWSKKEESSGFICA